MKCPCLISLFALSFCMSTIAQPRVDPKIAAFLTQYRLDYINSIGTGNIERLAPYLQSDCRIMTEFQKTIIGKDNCLQYYKALTSRFSIDNYQRNALEIVDMGRMIAEVGTLKMNLKLRSTGKMYPVQGKYISLWQKAESGTVTLITDAWNYDHQLEIGDQLRFSEVPSVDVATAPHVPVDNNISFELAALNRMMEETVSQKDAKIWSLFYADDCFAMNNFFKMNHGRKEIDTFLETHSKEMPVFEKLDVRNDRIDNLGKYVIEYASHIAVWRNGSYSGVSMGKDLAIWRREPDGSLKIYLHLPAYD